MSTWTEYDPTTGLQEINTYDEEKNAFVVHKQQDVTALLDRNKYLANTGSTDAGIKKGLWHYASIPVTVQYEMLVKHGVNIQNRNHYGKVFDLINKEYPYLKTTAKNHSVPRNR